MQNTKMAKQNFTTLDKCVICNGDYFSPIFSTENICLTGVFPLQDDGDPIATPLTLMRCNGCDNIQMKEKVNPELMFREYWYRSSTTQSMKNHLRDIAHSYSQEGCHWLDIGCNDGTLMDIVSEMSAISYGVDPSGAVQDARGNTRERIINDFFTADVAQEIRAMAQHKFDVVSAISMFYDVPMPALFLDTIAGIMQDDGTVLIEVNYAKHFFERKNVDMLGQEHLVYYSIDSFTKLTEKTKLNLVDGYTTDMNGGNITFILKKQAAPKSERLNVLIDKEKKWLNDFDFSKFEASINREFTALKQYLESYSKTKSIKILGASTRGAFIAQLMSLNSNIVKSAVDLQINKKGRRIPGTDISIEYDPEHEVPDAYLVMPYQFKDEIIKRYDDYLSKNGVLIFYRPIFSKIEMNDGIVIETPLSI